MNAKPGKFLALLYYSFIISSITIKTPVFSIRMIHLSCTLLWKFTFVHTVYHQNLITFGS